MMNRDRPGRRWNFVSDDAKNLIRGLMKFEASARATATYHAKISGMCGTAELTIEFSPEIRQNNQHHIWILMVSWNRQKHILIYEGILENDRMIPRKAGRLGRARLIRLGWRSTDIKNPDSLRETSDIIRLQRVLHFIKSKDCIKTCRRI